MKHKPLSPVSPKGQRREAYMSVYRRIFFHRWPRESSMMTFLVLFSRSSLHLGRIPWFSIYTKDWYWVVITSLSRRIMFIYFLFFWIPGNINLLLISLVFVLETLAYGLNNVSKSVYWVVKIRSLRYRRFIHVLSHIRTPTTLWFYFFYVHFKKKKNKSHKPYVIRKTISMYNYCWSWDVFFHLPIREF